MTYGTTSCTESNGNPDRSRDGRRDGFSPVPIPNPARQAGAEPIDIRDAWAESAPALAAWTDKHLVNRRDAFGHYRAVESRTDPDLTAYTDKGELTQAVLNRHFRGESTGDLIGLHATVRDEPQAACWSCWVALDIDRHDNSVDPGVTWKAARTWYDRALGLGFCPLLIDSNGHGGYHLLLVFDGPVATERVHRFGKWLSRDWKEFGSGEAPEVFPKQESIKPGGFGNWLRLPGRHHTREHFTRVWDGSAWLEGKDAVRAILTTTGTPGDKIPAEASKPERPPKPKRVKIPNDLGRDARLAEEALPYLKHLAGPYEDWLRIGMSLTPLGAAGLALWDDWSQSCPEKYDEGACKRKWRTFDRDGGLTLATLFHEAKQNGWPGPTKASANGDSPRDSIALGSAKGHPTDLPTEADRVQAEDPRPVIVISTEEYKVIDQAAEALAADPELYQRGTALVRVAREKSRPQSVIRAEGSPRIDLVPPANLRDRLTRVARWAKLRKTRDGDQVVVAANPPDWAVAGVAARGEWAKIRPIESVVETPVLRRDGSILEAPGYDEKTGLLYIPKATFPPLPEFPTHGDAQEAAERLLALVSDFPFAGVEHKAAWFASLLTPLGRFAIAGPCPLFLFDANTAGSGKTMLCDITSLLATGRDCARTAYPATNEEMDKRILAIALAGYRMVLFDNLETGGALGGPALDAALTGTSYNGRILARSEMANDIPLFTVWYATGNNLGLRGDAVRRIVPCRLDSRVERPEERSDFQIPDLLAHIFAHRGELVAAALTILRAYVVAGQPEPVTKLTPIGFPAWERVVRRAVHWAIGVDPCQTREEIRAADESASQLPTLLAGWKRLCEAEGKDSLTAAEALRAIDAKPDDHAHLRGLLVEWSKDGKLPTPRILGNHLNKIRGRVSQGDVIDSKLRNGIRTWYVRPVGPHPSIQTSGGSSGSGGSRSSLRAVNCADNCKIPDKCNTNFSNQGREQSHQSHQSHQETRAEEGEEAEEREVFEL